MLSWPLSLFHAQNSDSITAHPLQVYVTGHSLGGALATLAAFDIAKALQGVQKETHVVCYTFGAPRTGNHAFAHDYQKVVPDTWSIINDQVCTLLPTLVVRCRQCADVWTQGPDHAWLARPVTVLLSHTCTCTLLPCSMHRYESQLCLG